MPGKPREDLAQRPSAVCRQCGIEKPASAFYPSTLARQVGPSCRICHDRNMRAAARESRAQTIERLRAAFDGAVSWTAKAAAAALGYDAASMGARLEAIRKAGLIERIGEGVYRFPDGPIAESVAAPVEPPAPTAPPVAVALPLPASGGPLCLVVGSYIVPMAAVAGVIVDEAGRAEVAMLVQETRLKDGMVAPMTWAFTAAEWAARVVMPLAEALSGGAASMTALQEQVAQHEQALADMRRRYHEAQARAQSAETKLNRLASALAA